jgi:hypothetical protein
MKEQITLTQVIQWFILLLPYVMATIFAIGAFFRVMVYFTVKRHEWFSREFERRVNKYVEGEVPGQTHGVSFFQLAKKMLERTYYEVFEVRDRSARRSPDRVMAVSDRIFLIKPGCAWLVKDILKQLKFLKWTEETPKLLNITKATFHHNPCFNRVFGIIPIGALNDVLSILPGLFVIAGILGTFLGIRGGLESLGSMNLADLETTRKVMDNFLHEIAFAMSSSIVGIAFSLLLHVWNTMFSPDRVFVSMVDRFESALDLLWYRSDNNNYPIGGRPFDENRDPVEALAEQALALEVARTTKNQEDLTKANAS